MATATTTKFKIKRGNKASIADLVIEDGSLVIAKDTGEAFVDIAAKRISMGAVEIVTALPSTTTAIAGKLYFNTADNSLHRFVNGSFVKVTNYTMRGATSSANGAAGSVPAPKIADRTKFLRGDGTWQTITIPTYGDATQSQGGFLTPGDKTKIDELEETYYSGVEVYDAAGTTVAGTSGNATGQQIGLIPGSNVTLAVQTDGKVKISSKNTTYSVVNSSTNGLMSTADKAKLDGISAGAEVNQNAFSNITVGNTTIAADTKTDTLTIVAGSNVTITPDATNDKITIASKDTVYTHPSYTTRSSAMYKITVDNKGHVSAAEAVPFATDAQILALFPSTPS